MNEDIRELRQELVPRLDIIQADLNELKVSMATHSSVCDGDRKVLANRIEETRQETSERISKALKVILIILASVGGGTGTYELVKNILGGG